MSNTFSDASKFVGTGLNSWDTSSVTSLYRTFVRAAEMNVDLSAWKVGKVVKMEKTFWDASKFVGMGLNSWDTASVTTLQGSFNSASSFAGIGLWRWDVAKTTIIDANTLTGTKLDDCTKKRIASAWKFNDAFDATGTPALWTALVCPRRDDSRLNDAQIILVRQSIIYCSITGQTSNVQKQFNFLFQKI